LFEFVLLIEEDLKMTDKAKEVMAATNGQAAIDSNNSSSIEKTSPNAKTIEEGGSELEL